MEVLHAGRPGQLVFLDERRDGRIVVLVCEEHAGTGRGYLGVPERREAAPRPELSPLLGEAERQLGKPGFRVEVDTTALPQGPVTFEDDRFLDRVVEAAEALPPGEVARLALTPGNAPEFGLTTPAVPRVAAEPEADERQAGEAALRAARRAAEEEEAEGRRRAQRAQEVHEQQQEQGRTLET